VTPSGIVTTVAGTRTPGFSGDGGPAAQAQLLAPHGIAVDAAGNVYITDQGNHRVRRVGLDGVIKTIAGDGRTGSSGDGGLATQAAVGFPAGVAVDGPGNIYISMQMSQTIRRISRDGIITTIAGTGTAGFSGDGGPATQAQLNVPVGIAADPAGNVYFADHTNNRIRKISVTGIINTVAGNGSQGFSGDGGPATGAAIDGPFGVAVDRAGVVYVTDSRNSRIRRVGLDGVITTIAGTGDPGFSGDSGPPTQARLQGPHGVVVDAAGTVYIADTANDRIRKVSAPKP
jgi:sugar lactone lactonase YvrE